MTENIENRGKDLDLYFIRGEAASFWLPLILAVMGGLSSIFFAKAVLNLDFSINSLFAFSSKDVRQQEQIKQQTINTKMTGLSVGATNKIRHEKSVQNEKNAATPDVTSSITTRNEKEESTGVSNAEKKPTPLENHIKIDAAVVNKTRLPIDHKIPMTQDCPPRFFFTFPRGSDIPIAQNIKPKIKQLINWLETNPETTVLINGHTDSYGPAELNLLLSYRRAKAAQNILITAGISEERLITRAFGKDEPIDPLSPKSKVNRIASVTIKNFSNCKNTSPNGDIN